MKTRGVSPRGQKHHCDASVNAMLVTLANPGVLLAVVWRIAENNLASPVPRKPVIGRREMLRAFRVFRRGARVKRKAELAVKLIEQVLRRFPIFVAGFQQCLVQCFRFPSLYMSDNRRLTRRRPSELLRLFSGISGPASLFFFCRSPQQCYSGFIDGIVRVSVFYGVRVRKGAKTYLEKNFLCIF